jgi:hypothetical protein
MKRKVALFLALVMVVSMLPMNAFGNVIRPAQFTELVAPSHDPNLFRLSIDSAILSQVVIPEGGNLYLDFTLQGENAGFRIFANNSERSVLNDEGVLVGTGTRRYPAVERNDDKYTGHSGRLAFTIDTRGVTGPAALVGAAGANGQMTAVLGRSWDAQGNPALDVSPFNANNVPGLAAGSYTDPAVYRANPVIDQLLQLASGVSTWEGEFTVSGLMRRRLPGDRNFREADLGNEGRDTAPMEHWKTIIMPIAGVDTGWGTANRGLENVAAGRGETHELEGMMHVFLPLIAPTPGSTLRARLMSTSSAGRPSMVRDIGTFDIAGAQGTGVRFESRGVVPMTNIARLNAIRITENTLGLLTSGADGAWGVNAGGHHIVRIAAPRGFRWDTGAMTGVIHDDQPHMRGNPVVFGPAAARRLGDGLNWETNGGWLDGNAGLSGAGGQWADSVWLNPTTDRHEIYVWLQVPPRRTELSARTQQAWIDIEGLVLIPVSGAPTSGDVAVDLWLGTTYGTASGDAQWQYGVARPTATAANTGWGRTQAPPSNPRFIENAGAAPAGPTQIAPANVRDRVFLLGETLPGGRVRQTRFGWFGENDAPGSRAPSGVPGSRADNFSHMNLVVANLDNTEGVTVSAGQVADLVSGRVNAPLTTQSTDRFIVRGDFSIRLTENMPRAMFRHFDRYEIRSATEGVNIVDAEFRIGNTDRNDDVVGWTNPYTRANSTTNNAADAEERFVTTLTNYEGGSLFFAPRTLDHDEEGRLRTMDIRMMLSIQAGFEANIGQTVEFEIYRNDELLGSAIVANVKDPIRLTRDGAPITLDRDQFDVIPLTPVGNITIEETEVGTLKNNDEIWLHVQATQDGRPVSIPNGMLSLFLGDFVVNEASGMSVEPLRDGVGFRPQSFTGDEIRSQMGLRVVRPSANVAGTITFPNVYVAGPAVPRLQWHVVATGADRTYRGNGEGDVNHGFLGLTPNSHRFFPADLDEDAAGLEGDQFRARHYGMGYFQTVLVMDGDPDIDNQNQQGPGGGFARRSFTVNTLYNVDGHDIQAVAFPQVAPGIVSSMMNPRVFADFVNATMIWNDSDRTATFTGKSTHGIEQTVVLTLDSPTIMVNGQSFDIATRAGQAPRHVPVGSITPVVIANRQYVPARVLADIFGVPISFEAGTVTLG